MEEALVSFIVCYSKVLFPMFHRAAYVKDDDKIKDRNMAVLSFRIPH